MFKKCSIIIGLLVIFIFLACPNDPEPISEPPSEPSQDGKTYLKIENKTQFAVNVYINDPPLYNAPAETLRKVPAGGSEQWELQPTAEGKNGETLYFEYLIPVGSTTVPFYPRNTENVKLKKLEAGMVNIQEVPALGSAKTDSSYVLIKNNTNDKIWVEEGLNGGVSFTKYPFGSSTRDVDAWGDAVYVFGSDVTSLQNFTIGNTSRKSFSNTTLIKGYVYTFIFDGKNNPGLFLMEPFDPDMAKKIWSVPTSTNIGKYMRMGKQRVRRNPSDGIVVLGCLDYSQGIGINSRAYFALVNQYGEVTTERIFSLPNDPVIAFLEVHERANGDFIISYLATYEAEEKMFVMCYTQNGITKWQVELKEQAFSFFDPASFYIEVTHIAEKDNKTFAIGGTIQEEHQDGYYNAVFVTEVKENALGTDATISWANPYISDFTLFEDDGTVILSTQQCKGLVYNAAQDAYIVIELSAKNKKEEGVYRILSASNGSIISKNSPGEFSGFGFMGIHQDENRYYVFGEYLDQNGKYSAAALSFKFDMTLDPNFTTVFVPSDSGFSEFDACVSDKYKLAFAGKIYNGNKWLPWTYAVDKTNGTKLWENVYDDVDYNEIWNMDINSIGTLQLEFWDWEYTGSSLLVSTDLLGKISGEKKAAIPRNSNFIVNPPQIPTTYTVTYNVNGGTGTTPAAQTVNNGTSVTLVSGNGLSKSGYTFGGWNTNSSGTGTNYDASYSYTFTGNITLYAKWNTSVSSSYTVTFNINGGTGITPAQQTANVGSDIQLPGGNGFSKSGYTFDGWNTNSSGTGTNYNAGSSYTFTGNITLYAKWNTIVSSSYTVTFNINGGTGITPAQQTVNAGFDIQLPDGNGFSNSGYTFEGWNTNSSGTGTNYDASSAYTPTGNITLFAKWTTVTITTYTVTYNINNGTGTAPTAQTVNAGSSVTLASGSGFSRSGYIFGGWNTNSSGTGTNYDASSFYTPTGSITLYAKWTTTSVLAPPSNITAIPVNGGIRISWNSVSNAQSYTVYRATSATGTYSAVTTTVATTYLNTTSGTTMFYYKVATVNADGVTGNQSAYVSSAGPGSLTILPYYTNENTFFKDTITSTGINYYRFQAPANKETWIEWADSYDGQYEFTPALTGDILVSAYYEDTGEAIFEDIDDGYFNWDYRTSFYSGSTARYVIVKVVPYDNYSAGTYCIKYDYE